MSARKNTKREAGSKGGRATVERHGREHMQRIGQRGAVTTWSRYYLAPYGIGGYAMVNRRTHKVRAIR